MTGATSALRAELEAAIEAGRGHELGSGYQASVHLYRTSAGDVVVKTPHGGPFAALWRALLKREHAVYARLDGIPGVPRSFGLVGDERLALEFVAGPSLREHETGIADRDAFFAKLLATIRAMHAAGVAHGDLKRKDNVIVGPGETPYLIDFGVAVRRSATNALFNRCVFAPFVRLEESRNPETGGVGLGMAISRSIVRGHGGDITLENRPGPHGVAGLRVLVRLPRDGETLS